MAGWSISDCVLTILGGMQPRILPGLAPPKKHVYTFHGTAKNLSKSFWQFTSEEGRWKGMAR